MLEERQRAAGEKVDGGLVSRNEEQERHGQQLVLAKPAPPSSAWTSALMRSYSGKTRRRSDIFCR
jgi:hypothetical protein